MTSVVTTLERTVWHLDDKAEMLEQTCGDMADDLIDECKALSAELRKILGSVGDCEIAIIPIARARPVA